MHIFVKRSLVGAALIFGLLTPLILSGCSQEVESSASATVESKVAADPSEIHIDDYSFGRITINCKRYDWDVAIVEDGTIQSWFASAEHEIQLTDLKYLLKETTKTMIIGTGYNGVTSVSEKAKKVLAQKGIELHVLSTSDAIDLYNRQPKQGLVACFHLNC